MIGISFGHCQAWYHHADGNRGVVLCSAQGFEELCSRSTMRLLASKLAAAGMPVLRFDYPGTADSAGGDDDPGLVAAWRQSIKDAAVWLKSHDGIDEIVVIGLRLGALLAALEMDGIDGLVGLGLLAPVLSGRQYTREAAILAKIMEAKPSFEGDATSGVAIDVCGFCISKETESALKALSLSAIATAKGVPVLLLAQRGLNAADFCRALAERGCTIQRGPFIGFEDLICDPTASKIPIEAIERVAGWATELGPISKTDRPSPLPAPLTAAGWTESAITFGPQGTLAGVICHPTQPDPNSLPVIFVNSGMNYHIGWSRSAVRQARTLAAAGITTLRYDTPGSGDSINPSGLDKLPLYNEIAEEGLVAAIDWLTAQGFCAPLITGSCSGAYAAFHVTRRDKRISKALIANLQCFEWTPAIGFVVDRWRETRRAEVAAKRDSENEDIKGSTRALATNLSLSIVAQLRRAGRVLKRFLLTPSQGADKDNRVLQWMTDLAARRCEIILVFARGDIGLTALEAATGPAAAKAVRLPGVSLHILENCDHSITPRSAQNAITELIQHHAKPQHRPRTNSSQFQGGAKNSAPEPVRIAVGL